MEYLLYKLNKNKITSHGILPKEFQLYLWRPSVSIIPPKGLRKFSIIIWIFFHYLLIFKNKKLGIVYIKHIDCIISRLLITPGYFRFPFMDFNDLQIGDVWTCNSYRGKGLASYSLSYALRLLEAETKSFFYIVEGANNISIKLAVSRGFELVATGTKKNFLISFISYYDFM